MLDQDSAPDALSIRSARVLVVLVGASVSIVAAVVAWWLGVPFAAAILAGGAVAGPLAAVRRARALVGPGWVGAAIASGIEAPFVATALIVVIAGVAAGPGSSDVPGSGIGAVLGWSLFAALYAAIFGLPFALPVAIVAGFLVRRAARLEPRTARRHVALLTGSAVLLGIVALAGVTGVLARVAPGIAPVDWARESAAVVLDVTVDNRTKEEPEFEIGWREVDGTSGMISGAGPCSRTRGQYLMARADWYVARVVDDDFGTGTPIATAADWPGRSVAITLILEPGSTRVVAGASGTPDASEPVPGCVPAG